MLPIVSVIIPSYNASKYIVRTIQSVMEQTFQDWELLIIDDGSKDNTEKIVRPFLEDKRIIYIKKNNSGVSDTRNIGAEKSKGIYICFLDADDFFYPTNIEEKVDFLNKNIDVALVHANVQLVNEDETKYLGLNQGIDGVNLHEDLLLWEQTVVPAPSSIMMRKELFYEVGKWDIRLSTAADQDLFIRVASKYRIGKIYKVLTGYRVINGSMSKNVSLFEKDHLAVYEKATSQKLFPSTNFRNKAYSNLHLIIAAFWWNSEKHIYKTIKHILTSMMYSPYAIMNRIIK